MPLYSIYGLWVESNRELPGPEPLSAELKPSPDVRLELGLLPPTLTQNSGGKTLRYASPHRDRQGNLHLEVWQRAQDGYFWLQYCDGTEFGVDPQGQKVWAQWPDSLTLEDTATYLLGPILGFILRLRGVICLHASAVAIGDRAVAFLGAAGAGKSTLAAAFARQGYPILSDDVTALWEQKQGFGVQPGYPRLRLWPKSAIALYGSSEALPRIVPTHPTWDKRYLDLQQPGYSFQNRVLPLAKIYALSKRKTQPDFPKIERQKGQAAMMTLVSNTYATYLLDRKMRSAEFAVLSQLLRSVPLQQINPHTDVARLPQLMEIILDDLKF